MSAGIAFSFFLALIQAAGSLVSIYSVVADPSQILDLTQRLSNSLPGGGENLIISQLRDAVVSSTSASIGLGTVLGIVLAVWSASTGTTQLITALNIAYDQDPRSGFAVKRGVGILITIVLIGIATVGVFVGSRVLGLIDGAELAAWTRFLALAGFWIGVAGFMMAVLSGIYRFAPNREDPQWTGILWGAMAAVVLAVIATIGLRIYVANFSGFGEAYVSMTTIIIAMFYLFILAFAIILGAEIDHELQPSSSEPSPA